jgi:hypothetical protein
MSGMVSVTYESGRLRGHCKTATLCPGSLAWLVSESRIDTSSKFEQLLLRLSNLEPLSFGSKVGLDALRSVAVMHICRFERCRPSSRDFGPAQYVVRAQCIVYIHVGWLAIRQLPYSSPYGALTPPFKRASRRHPDAPLPCTYTYRMYITGQLSCLWPDRQ